MKKLSIIIVNYNVCYFLEQVLKSVYNSKVSFDYDVWVVDNNSVDASLKMLNEKFPNVKVIANKENVGFSRANNQAIEQSDADYVLLLNPDTVIEEETLQKCFDFMEKDPKAGALGVKMVDGRGEFLPESKRGLPTPKVAFYKISGLANLFPKSREFGQYHLKFLGENDVNEIDVLAGAFMFIRKDVYDQVGGLDNDYFMYGEDIDLSYKIQKAGYKNYYFPETKIIHYKGESTKKTSVNYVFVFYNAMVIFAKKHFTKRHAAIFSFLINIAIYLKASVQIIKNTVSKIYLTVLDAALIYLSMYFLKGAWEQSYKQTPTEYPKEFLTIVIPVYILIWLVSNHFSGGNDRPFRLRKILRGIVVGTVLIAALTNFTDVYRYSKALIVLGGGVSVLVLILNRLFVHFITNKNFILEKENTKRIALVGDKEEFLRVEQLIHQVKEDLDVIGFIKVGAVDREYSKCLGELSQLDEIIEIYGLDELVFCSKDMSSQKIIEVMTQVDCPRNVDYKIVPDESNYIIGSNSKNRPGDYYTADVKLNLAKKESQRSKRIIDLGLSLFVLLTFPVLVFFVESKNNLFSNLIKVVFGKKTWVGFATNSLKITGVKKSVITPVSSMNVSLIDEGAKKRLDLLYAKDYNYWVDIDLFFRNIKCLGA